MSQKILIAKKNLFFFNIFNKNLDFSKKLIDFKKLYKTSVDFDNYDDCYLSIIKINKYKKYTFNPKRVKKRKRRKNKFYRSIYLLFKHYGVYNLGNIFKKIKKVNFHNKLKNWNHYYKKTKALSINPKYFKIKFFLNISSYKLFFNILLFYPFLFLNYSFWFFFKDFFKIMNYKPVNINDINDNPPYYDLSFFTNFGLFLELQTKKNVNVIIKKNYFKDISFFFNIILNLWAYRIRRFFGVFKNSFDLYYIVKMFFLVVKNKDIHLLMKLITKITPKIEFNKQRRFFKFIIYMFRCYYSLIYGLYKLQGFQFEFKGKISVDGNARTRKMYAKILRPSPSNYSYSTKYVYKTVKTHTGILGIKVWIYYKQ